MRSIFTPVHRKSTSRHPRVRITTVRLFAIITILLPVVGTAFQAVSLPRHSRPTKWMPLQREDNYTITSVMRILKPFRLADMNDDYQQARLLSQDKDSATVEITYYPLLSRQESIGENTHWKQEDATMHAYLDPTPTENWDRRMQRDLITALKAQGIDPDRLTDRALVEQVSDWAFRRSQFTNAFAAWYVTFPNGKPEVAPDLRQAFDGEKPNASWSDQQMFDREVLGKQMYYNRVHGSCTSSAVYLATILRALGIPTRIVVCIPPVDPNDSQQVDAFLAQIHHHQVKAILTQALTEQHGWCNHLFNEVFVGHHWVRLNYNHLGQDSLDVHYMGLLTHIYTCRSLSELPLAQTWGKRYARYDSDPKVQPRLTSVNPYTLLRASDHFGAARSIANPPVDIPELRDVTIIGLYTRGAPELPAAVQPMLGATDFALCIREWIDGQDYKQLRRFFRKASHTFVLKATGQPDVPVYLNGSNFNDSSVPGKTVQGFVAHVNPLDWQKLANGVPYVLQPANMSHIYRWSITPGVRFIRTP